LTKKDVEYGKETAFGQRKKWGVTELSNWFLK